MSTQPDSPLCLSAGSNITMAVMVFMLMKIGRYSRPWIGHVKMGLLPLQTLLMLGFVFIPLGFGKLGENCSNGFNQDAAKITAVDAASHSGMYQHCGLACLETDFQAFYLCRPWYVL